MTDPAARIFGYRIIVNEVLPVLPSPRVEATRIVRHGLADVLAWLGEPVGPKPKEELHVHMAPGHMFVSQQVYKALERGLKTGPDGYLVPSIDVMPVVQGLYQAALGRPNKSVYFDPSEVS